MRVGKFLTTLFIYCLLCLGTLLPPKHTSVLAVVIFLPYFSICISHNLSGTITKGAELAAKNRNQKPKTARRTTPSAPPRPAAASGFFIISRHIF